MSDFILIKNDQVIFNPSFGMATVVVRPGMLAASSKNKIMGKNISVEGDEKQVQVPGCAYTAGPYSIPGVGTLKIDSLAPNQKSKKTKDSNKPVLLKGGQFIAKFEVTAPAMQPQPTGTVPDSNTQYTGSGSFVTTNIKVKGI